MARIRDLGIHVIPVTMRPLEIGPGAAAGMAGDESGPDRCIGTGVCHACDECEAATGLPADTSCDPSGICPAGTCGDTAPACAEQSCPDRGTSGRPPRQHSGAFSDDAVAQLKRQLRTQIGREMVN